jgi:hypothetical protein
MLVSFPGVPVNTSVTLLLLLLLHSVNYHAFENPAVCLTFSCTLASFPGVQVNMSMTLLLLHHTNTMHLKNLLSATDL